MNNQIVQGFEAAVAVIRAHGILPISSFMPDHPSLGSITEESSWHTGLDTDPWLWRDRFAGEGMAAYGRFFAKKPMFIAAEIFPLVKAALGAENSVERRYRDGLLSNASVS